VFKLSEASRETGAKLAGAAPTTNLFYFKPENRLSTSSFIVGDFMLIQPCPMRFDEELRLKEDYDYTLKHLARYNVVARCNDLFAYFTHRSNGGGAVEYRTAEREQEAIARLKQAWGARIADNPKRPNEVILRWK
jgi:hypothetical protein